MRLYNFDTEDNYVLSPDMSLEANATCNIVCLASDLKLGLLAVGTASGAISIFKYTPPESTNNYEPILDLAKCWEMQPGFQVNQMNIIFSVSHLVSCWRV